MNQSPYERQRKSKIIEILFLIVAVIIEKWLLWFIQNILAKSFQYQYFNEFLNLNNLSYLNNSGSVQCVVWSGPTSILPSLYLDTTSGFQETIRLTQWWSTILIFISSNVSKKKEMKLISLKNLDFSALPTPLAPYLY